MYDDASEVKQRLDIAEVIGDYVQLRRRGSSLWGLCPFHAEKTPSFAVSPERGTFHCFGCGKGGDVFTFLMEIEGIPFTEALSRLAERAGVTLSRARGGRERGAARAARDVLTESLAFFRANLADAGGTAARAYLDRRDLGAEMCSRFEIGWAPQSWDALKEHLLRLGFDERTAISSGMLAEGERSSYDRFRGRITFPVRDETGKLVGFGGRIIDSGASQAKYVNSPEGELFSKGRMLYMMHEAKRTIRERGRAILTEGYMDAIRCHAAGFTETVASLGTSLTEGQAALIKRFTDLCIIVYDGDSAGQAASLRGMYLLKRAGVDVRVATLPEGRDPDEVLASDGAEAFESALRKALPLPLFHVRASRARLMEPGRRASATEEILTSLAQLPALELASYIPSIAKAFGVLQHELQREIDARRGAARYAARRPEPQDSLPEPALEQEPPAVRRTLDLECATASLLWRDEASRARSAPDDVAALFTDGAVAGIVAALLSGERPEDLEARWRAMGDEICPERIARGDAVADGGGLTAEHLPHMISELRTRAMTRRYEELKSLIIAESADATAMAEYTELARRLKGGAE